MVSAGAGNKKALGIDRAPNPWSDIPLADVVWVAGSNVAETFPITTSYIWRARDRGAKLIVAGPAGRARSPAPPTCSCRCGPGTDSALFGAVLHVLIARDWLDHDFIDAHTDRLRRGRRRRRRHDAGVGGRRSPACPRPASRRPPSWWGTAATGMLLHARGIEQQTKGVENVLAAHQPRPGHRQVRQARLRRVDDHRPGQRPGRPRARPQVRPAPRQPRHHQPRAPRRTSRRCGAATSREIPGKGLTAQEIIEAIHDGEIKGLLSICFNPVVSLARRELHRRGARQARVLRGHRLLPVRDRASTPTSCCPARCTRRTRARRPAARGGSSRSTPPSTPPGEARRDWEILLDIAERLGKGEYFPYTNTERDLRGAARRLGGRHRRLHAASPGSGSRTRWACSGRCPRRATPARRGCSKAASFYHPDGKARFHAGAVPAAGRGRRRRVPDLAHHRPGGQPVPVGHADPAHRPARRPVPRAAVRDAPAARRHARHRRRRPRHRHVAARRR